MNESDQVEGDDGDACGAERAEGVGYRRPPVASRFKPGQSGNPRGRPKGSKNIDTLCRSLLARKVTIQENGGRRKVSAVEAILLAAIQRAVRGDNRAARLLIDLNHRIAAPEGGDDVAASPGEDQAIVEAYMAKLLAAQEATTVNMCGASDDDVAIG